MDRERNYGMLRGCVLGRAADRLEKEGRVIPEN